VRARDGNGIISADPRLRSVFIVALLASALRPSTPVRRLLDT